MLLCDLASVYCGSAHMCMAMGAALARYYAERSHHRGERSWVGLSRYQSNGVTGHGYTHANGCPEESSCLGMYSAVVQCGALHVHVLQHRVRRWLPVALKAHQHGGNLVRLMFLRPPNRSPDWSRLCAR